jgi:hypothetical protein
MATTSAQNSVARTDCLPVIFALLIPLFEEQLDHLRLVLSKELGEYTLSDARVYRIVYRVDFSI